VRVRHDEGIASRIGPEPCVGSRKAADEASAGECAGQPWSHERIGTRVPTLLRRRKAKRRRAIVRARRRPGVVVEPGMRASALYGNREIPFPTGGRPVRAVKARSRNRR